MCRQQEKDYSLLRPFDLEAAMEGEAIHDLFGGRVHFMDGPDAGGKFAVRVDGHFAAVLGDQLRMAPLAWVEGKPVYPGETNLWHKSMGQKVTVCSAVDTLHVLCDFEIDRIAAASIEALTWTPPKVKRNIKLVAFIDDYGTLRWVREELFELFANRGLRVPSEDKTVEIED